MNILKSIQEFFEPKNFNDMDVLAVGEALNDLATRTLWINMCLEDIKRINREIDKRVLKAQPDSITDLCAKRRAYQEILESAISARRNIVQGIRHNPRPATIVDLDRVTA